MYRDAILGILCTRNGTVNVYIRTYVDAATVPSLLVCFNLILLGDCDDRVVSHGEVEWDGIECYRYLEYYYFCHGSPSWAHLISSHIRTVHVYSSLFSFFPSLSLFTEYIWSPCYRARWRRAYLPRHCRVRRTFRPRSRRRSGGGGTTEESTGILRRRPSQGRVGLLRHRRLRRTRGWDSRPGLQWRLFMLRIFKA